jgi:hypothetical protein
MKHSFKGVAMKTNPTDCTPWVKSAWLDPGSAIRGLGLAMFVLIGSAYAEPQAAVCRVNNRLAAFNNVGSGTLIDTSEDGREGLVLTCAHLFSEGVGEVVVSFPGAKTHGAKLVAIDREADLAALAISNPASAQAAVDFDLLPAEQVKACGFGPHGEYACAAGPVVGEASNAGQMSVLVGNAVRSGDSGGGVFDADGNLVAVVWGESNGVTYASGGVPLKRFLDRVLGRRTGHVYVCPNGMCPRAGFGGVAKGTPLAPAAPVAAATSPAEIENLQRRVAALEQNKQDRGDYVTRGDLEAYLPRNRAPGIAKPPAAADRGQAAVGWGVAAVTAVGGWLAGRLLQRGVGGRREERFQ